MVTKLEFRSKQCAFLGYNTLHKGYKCLDIFTGRVYISRDIVFDETVLLFASLHANAGAQLKADILLLPSELQPTHMHDHEGHELQIDNDANPADHVVVESSLQESAENSGPRGYSDDFSGYGTETGEDYPAQSQTTSSPGSTSRSASGSVPAASDAASPGVARSGSSIPPSAGSRESAGARVFAADAGSSVAISAGTPQSTGSSAPDGNDTSPTYR
jgi:hypothetical protein